MSEHIIYFDWNQGANIDPALEAAGHTLKALEGPVESCPDELTATATVITMHTSSKVDKAVIDRFPQLKLIACRSTGTDHVDVAYAHERNITVVNVPTYGANTVAEYAFMLLLALTRKLTASIAAVRHGNIDPAPLQGIDLAGKTIGVVGTGNIGQHAIKMAKGFEMTVLGYDLFPKNELANQLGFTYVKLEELLSASDFVTLHLPGTPQTEHKLNAETFALMKPQSILINTARGSLVDTEALIDVLSNGRLAGAGIDVIEGEALLDSEAELHLLQGHKLTPEFEHAAQLALLSRMDNVILTAHNAFNSREALARIQQITAQNILAFLTGKPEHEVKA